MKFPFLYRLLWIYLQLACIFSADDSDKIHFTDSWAVHIENGSADIASHIAGKHGFYNFGQIGSLPGYFHFVRKKRNGKRRRRRELDQTVTLLSEEKIKWVEQQHVLDRDKRSIVPDYIQVIHPNGYTIQDPAFNDQWYLNNVGQSSGPGGLDINVLPVWARGISGRNVVVAILDDGLDHTHPDLKKNYDAKASYDFNDYDEDPMPRSSDPSNCHGTKCAGEVAMEAGNGICGVGVAFNSSIGGIRMLDGNTTDTIEGSALSFKKDYIDIYSCAWGPKDDGKRFGRPGTLASKALELGAKEGRKGLGSIFVWATGNGGLTDDDCNCDGYTTSVYTVSVGAISDHGLSTYYTESCASTLAVTYSGGSHREKKENKIVTTTLNHECTDEFKGTSSAAPLAAGMIALVLEANRNLTWRDVQHIIVETSLMTSPLDEGWRRNGAGKWFNQKFGFGRMDAAAMVEKAQSWRNVADARICWSDKSAGPWPIPSSGTVLVAMNASSCEDTLSEIKTLEHVQVVLSLKHRHRGHLSIELISPSGTRTQLLKTRRNDKSTKGLKDWVFMSVHFWGEDPKGVWTLAVTDNSNNNREHHRQKNKYGDLEDATQALQDEIEAKDDDKDSEHEKIVDDEESYKSSEEFENNVFKDDSFRKKKKQPVEPKVEPVVKPEKPEKPHHSSSKNKPSEQQIKPVKKISKKPVKQHAAEKVLPPAPTEEEEKEEEKLVEELLLEAKPGGQLPEYPSPQNDNRFNNPDLNPERFNSQPNLQPTSSFNNGMNMANNQPLPAKKLQQQPQNNLPALPNNTVTKQQEQPKQNTSTSANEENVMLENVLKTVLSEAFNNFRSESGENNNFEQRLKGLESALYHHNKTDDNSVATTLIKAFRGGKAIDKINNVLGVLENTKNQSQFTNTSFYKNSEVVGDVLKVLKDIMSSKKDDTKLKTYKHRISKLLETSSNSTRKLTEKLFNDIEPKTEGKELSSSVIEDALNLISHIFRRKKLAKNSKHRLNKILSQQNEKMFELPKDVSILLKGPKGKVLLPYSSIQDMITEDKKGQPSLDLPPLPVEHAKNKNIDTITIEHTNIQKTPLNDHKEISSAFVEPKLESNVTVKEDQKLLEEKHPKEYKGEVEKEHGYAADEHNPKYKDENEEKHEAKYHEENDDKSYAKQREEKEGNEEKSYAKQHEEENNYESIAEKEYYHNKENSLANEDNFYRKSKENEESPGGYTIAIMKNGKKIGERKVNNEQANRYLEPHHESFDQNSAEKQSDDENHVRGKPENSEMNIDVLIDKSKNEENTKQTSEDKELKPENPYIPRKTIGFDVSKFGNEEVDEGKPHSLAHPETEEVQPVQMVQQSNENPVPENDRAVHNGKKFEIRVDSELIPKSISYDLGGDKKHTLHHRKTPTKHKSKAKKKHKQPAKDYDMYNDQEEEFNLSDAIPIIQIADPSQLAAMSGPPPSENENDNFMQQLYEPFNSNQFENSPPIEEQAAFYNSQRNNFVSHPRKLPRGEVRKRSLVNNDFEYSQHDMAIHKPTEYSNNIRTERTRLRRSLDKTDGNDRSLLREKRSKIVDDEDEDGPHVVKRSAIFSELYPSRNSITKKSTIEKVFKKLQAVGGGNKRSAVRKAVKLEGDLKKKLLNMNQEGSSVIDIIKRVHDDISSGNSKDLRKLEKDLASLETSKASGKQNIETIKQQIKIDRSAVRTKVARKPNKIGGQDPDEYYKYGVDSSGELENWTLRFYGTGP